MEAESIKSIYRGYSNVYDVLFKGFFFPRIKEAIASMGIKPGDTILDIGVGTGLSLPLFPDYCQVIGIDLSEEMLRKARKKVRKFGLHHIHLQEMDAMSLAYPDNTFDKVFASHVVSVVPDPNLTLSEAMRVCKPGGTITIVNHFQSENKVIAKVEEMISPLCKKVGWRSDLAMDVVRDTDLRIDRNYKLNKVVDLWSIVIATNKK